MSRGLVCAVHRHDSTVPQEDHHIWPKGYHGPDTAANRVKVCCNGHSDTHYFMEALLRSGGVSPPDWRTYGPDVRALASSGFTQVMAYAESLVPR